MYHFHLEGREFLIKAKSYEDALDHAKRLLTKTK